MRPSAWRSIARRSGSSSSDAPWIPLTHGIAYILVKPYVQGFQASAALYPWLKDIIDRQTR